MERQLLPFEGGGVMIMAYRPSLGKVQKNIVLFFRSKESLVAHKTYPHGYGLGQLIYQLHRAETSAQEDMVCVGDAVVLVAVLLVNVLDHVKVKSPGS